MHAELAEASSHKSLSLAATDFVIYQQPHIYFEKNMAATHFHLNKLAAANKL